MKKVFLLSASLLAVAFVSRAQTLEDATKHLYYERMDAAKNILTSLVSKENAAPEAFYWLSQVYLEQGKTDSAEAIVEAGMKLYNKNGYGAKKNPLLPLAQAQLLLEKGQTEAARTAMEAVLSASKNKNATALHAAARANLNSNKGDSLWAMELLQQAAQRDKKNPAIFVTLGDAYRKRIDGSNAIINYDKALKADEDYAEAIHKKARIYKTQQNPDIYLPLFKKALSADSTYAPTLYELYFHYYFRDVKEAEKYLQAYFRHSDPSPENAYMMADLHYVSKEYAQAITDAKNILQTQGEDAAPRMYKLLAYSNAALGDSVTALTNMNTYFDKQEDTGFVAKDYAMKANLLLTAGQDTAQAISLFTRAFETEQEEKEKLDYVVNLANLHNILNNRAEEARWREQVYLVKEPATNLDIYKWGLASYYAKDYPKADSVFAIYQEKYPDQVHGYFWRARSGALMDTTMALGLAVPHYTNLVELAREDSVANKALLVTAFEYLGAYEANTTKDYNAALNYYNNILSLEPTHEDATKYAGILENWIADGKGMGQTTGDNNSEAGETSGSGNTENKQSTTGNQPPAKSPPGGSK